MSKKFETIEAYIQWGIDSGLYKSKNKLPSENELAIKYQCSRLTARKALQSLVEQGIILSKKGKGYFVSNNKSKPKTTVQSSNKKLIVSFYKTGIKFDEMNKETFKEMGIKINKEIKNHYHYVKEYFNENREIISLNHLMINTQICSNINETQMEKSFAYFLNKQGIQVSKKIEKVKVIIPNIMLRMKLNIEQNEQVITTHTVLYDKDEKIITAFVKYTKLKNFETTYTSKYL